MADEGAQNITVNIKGPSEIKLTVEIALDATVRALKEKIESARSDVPADSQRLIYSGKVLKDEETLQSYKLQNNHTVHMVRSAARSAPTTGNPATSQTSGSNSAPSGTTPATNSSAAQGIPANFGAGQAYGSDPLAALNRADFAGPHMAQLGDQMFRGTGLNPNDPNMLMTAMQSDEFRNHMRSMLGRPEVIDQIIASNPQLASLPGARELLRSEQFREFLLDPQSMQRAAELSRTMGGAGGLGGLGGLGGFGAPGAMGGQGAGQQWPPPGAFGQAQQGEQRQGQAAGGNQQAGANPFAGLGGAGPAPGGGGGGGGGGGAGMFDPAFLQQILGGAGGGAGRGANPFGGFGRPPTDSRPPEERYAEQLAQMQGMGLTDGAANLRALLTAGGSVEGAMSILFDDPSGGSGSAPGS